ncbi:hypothetical protein RHOSPDRAFT_33224 [Rhodotorula sp. JG-1b]|nr:hypothetical protein RHOSPDRAFT_33224 [Rhodotorula sp. JG-1b]
MPLEGDNIALRAISASPAWAPSIVNLPSPAEDDRHRLTNLITQHDFLLNPSTRPPQTESFTTGTSSLIRPSSYETALSFHSPLLRYSTWPSARSASSAPQAPPCLPSDRSISPLALLSPSPRLSGTEAPVVDMSKPPWRSPFPPDFEPVGTIGDYSAQTPASPRRSSSFPLPTQPTSPQRPVFQAKPSGGLERGAMGAIGPKAGAQFLASQQPRRPTRQVNELEQFGDADERDYESVLRQQVVLHADVVSNAVDAQSTSARLSGEPSNAPVDKKPHERSTNPPTSQHPVHRVPVPRLVEPESEIHSPRPVPLQDRRMSIHDLTRQASEEEKLEDSDEADRRKESLSRASGAGLGSPFAAGAAAATAHATEQNVASTTAPIEPLRKHPHRRPPISGLNRAMTSPEDSTSQGLRDVSYSSLRPRKVSAGSTASVSKDAVLDQLSDAIRRERRKAEAYRRERKQGQLELDEIERNLQVLREKYWTISQRQEETIESLRSEIVEVKAELEWANDLDEETAEKYLELISSSTPKDKLRSKRDVVSGFDPSALGDGTANSPLPTTSPLPSAATMETVKRAANLFRRGLSLKRRIDTRVAAYGSVEDVSLSKNPTFSQESRATATRSSGGGGGGNSQVSLLQAGQLPPPRTRKLTDWNHASASFPGSTEISHFAFGRAFAARRKATSTAFFPPRSTEALSGSSETPSTASGGRSHSSAAGLRVASGTPP